MILPSWNVKRSQPFSCTTVPSSASVPENTHSDTPRFPLTKWVSPSQRASGNDSNTEANAARTASEPSALAPLANVAMQRVNPLIPMMAVGFMHSVHHTRALVNRKDDLSALFLSVISRLTNAASIKYCYRRNASKHTCKEENVAAKNYPRKSWRSHVLQRGGHSRVLSPTPPHVEGAFFQPLCCEY